MVTSGPIFPHVNLLEIDPRTGTPSVALLKYGTEGGAVVVVTVIVELCFVTLSEL
ncbi:hypothetical protein D3C80_1915180 [compost metagenome]